MLGEPQQQADSPAPLRMSLDDIEPEDFGSKFGRLQSGFKQKFGRDFSVTGQDTPVHVKLHGEGMARDVRVKDMSDDEKNYVRGWATDNGVKLLDYSNL